MVFALGEITVTLCNSRIYPRFLPQLEKTHETFPTLRDEALFPCIVAKAIAFSQSNIGESQGRGSLVGYHLWGCTELDTTEVT